MKVSKIKVAIKYFSGGIAAVAEYLLDLFNEMIQTLPKDEVAKYAQLAKDVASFIDHVCEVLITDHKKQNAARWTAQCFGELALALVDSNVTKDEIAGIVDATQKAIDAWKVIKA